MRDFWVCPIRGCGWEYALPPDNGTASYARSVTALVESHAESHPIVDYLRTIRDLEHRLTLAQSQDAWVK